MNTFLLEDKICVITGGVGDIALAVADLVLKRQGKVFLCDLKPRGDGVEVARSKLKHFDEVKVGYTTCDVTKRESFEDAFEECKSRFGVPDILINNAGIVGEQRWEQIYDVNVKGTHLGIELAFKHMSKQVEGGKGGVVLNMSSTAGITCIGDMYTVPAYSSSKHAITAMTRNFGHDFHFRKTGVRVVALAPYFVDASLNANDFRNWTSDEEALAAIKEGTVGKDFLQLDDVALKLVNILSAKSGSIWMIRPNQLQPFNIPDYKLPHTQGYRSNDSFPKPRLYC